MVFFDEKFFRWNYSGPAQNSPIWMVGAHARPARKADLDPDVSINEHSQRKPGTMVGAAMVNGIVSRSQKPLKKRAPLGSLFTDAWRACAPEAATSITACDGPAHMHAFLLVSSLPILKHGPKSLTPWSVCANLQAP